MADTRTTGARLERSCGLGCPHQQSPGWDSTHSSISLLLSRREPRGLRRTTRERKGAPASVAVILAAVALGCIPSELAADSCRYEAERDATLAAENATRARIIAGAGKLEVRGHPGLDEIRIRGRACASDQETLDQIQLETGRSADEVRIEAKLPSGGRQFYVILFNRKRSFGTVLLDLEIDVPDSMTLDIADGAGHVAIRDTGPLELADGSGDIRIEDVAGNASVRDGSGRVDIRRVRGDVSLTDGSSDLSITEVAGSVRIRDGSGGIRVARVARDVTVTLDGSGSISVRKVEGDFSVERDGSGNIHYDDILGQVSLPD